VKLVPLGVGQEQALGLGQVLVPLVLSPVLQVMALCQILPALGHKQQQQKMSLDFQLWL
jgi:hypothetical protein